MEAVAKERLKHQKIMDEAREREKANPLSLAEMYRYMLWLTNEQIVDDPATESDPLFQIPLLKGSFVNKVKRLYRLTIYIKNQNRHIVYGILLFSDGVNCVPPLLLEFWIHDLRRLC